ncbi:MAG: hypothetical protein H7268_13255, partial [Sandarakinorhabdus sp.]|nr:hypothetical protein [Sandarakinorhabdus sp.]
MPITAAQIESNGWVLRLTLTGALSSPNTDFSAYTFDMNGVPRLTLTTSHPGFVKSGGTAVGGTRTRSIIGLKPLRNPANPIASGTLAAPTIDETDLGGGQVRVRIALAEMVYSGDTGLSLAVLGNWRAGEGAATGISVTNSSTIGAPLPIMRWVLPPYEVATGSFRLSLIVGSHHPIGFDPVAGVKFTVTDGTTTKTVWATALGDDNTYGDNLRCHTVLIDPATATALTAGLLRCDAEVYPYLGAMRSTDPAGTRIVATLADDGLSAAAEAPFVIGYDPAGTRYSNVYAFIDPVNGTNIPATGMIATTRTAAKAIAPASRPRNVMTAQHACRLLNRSFTNRLGTSYGSAGNTDGLVCTLAAGTHTDALGNTNGTLSASARTSEIPLTIEGDPTNSNPRANCILQTRAVGGQTNNAVQRLRLRNLTLEQGEASLMACTNKWLDNVEIRAKSGFILVNSAPIGGNVLNIASANWWVTRSKIWRSSWSLAYLSAGPAPG